MDCCEIQAVSSGQQKRDSTWAREAQAHSAEVEVSLREELQQEIQMENLSERRITHEGTRIGCPCLPLPGSAHLARTPVGLGPQIASDTLLFCSHALVVHAQHVLQGVYRK